MDNVLEVQGLTKVFEIRTHLFKTARLKAVSGIDFSIPKGKALGLVGESGCGKSTVARCLLYLVKPTSGTVLFKNKDLSLLNSKEIRKLRGEMQMVFQDPYDALNPRMTVNSMLLNALNLHTDLTKKNKVGRILELVDNVGLAEEHLSRYPHEFSGGQQQRIGIARALATGADFLILDEPTSALDTSVRGQILKLLISLQEKLNLSYLFITHDISIIMYLCVETAVMYLGKIVEIGPTEKIVSKPLNPYTQALMASIPVPDPLVKRKKFKVKGEPPSPIDIPKGCAFSTRCPFVFERCTREEPNLETVLENHASACFISNDFV
jgi:oligopeptide/dipeptide ABC transporter ATP-binding protein